MNALLSAVLLLTGSLVAGRVQAEEASTPEADAVTAAIEQARAQEARFHLVVHCSSEEEGIRRLEVFPSGVAVWRGRSQVTLDEAARRALLDTLLAKGFPSLAPSYGGKMQPKLEGEPNPAAPGKSGPLRVRCQVTYEGGGVSKTSIQEADGFQSPELAGLADSLLDRVEPVVAERGVGAEDLEDGLAKVAAGKLAPEVFTLRLVQLPGGGVALSEQKAGTILRVEQGTLVRRSYLPGKELGEPQSRELAGEQLAALARRLQKADLPSLPINLWSDDQVELAVRVLGHEKAVIARSFRGGKEPDSEAARKRFQGLLADLNADLLGESPAPGDGAAE